MAKGGRRVDLLTGRRRGRQVDMGAEDNAVPQAGNASSGGAVVQIAGDLRGDIRIGQGTPLRALGLLNPHTEARRLLDLPHDEAAELIASQPVTKSAKVVAALLSTNAPVAIALLGSIERERAEQLIAAIDDEAVRVPKLDQLPAASEAITQRAAETGWNDHSTEWITPAARSPYGSTGYSRSYQEGVIYRADGRGACALENDLAEYHAGHGGTAGWLGYPVFAPRNPKPIRWGGRRLGVRRRQDFEGGTVIAKSSGTRKRIIAIPRAVMRCCGEIDGVGTIGDPVGEATQTPASQYGTSGTRQEFEWEATGADGEASETPTQSSPDRAIIFHTRAGHAYPVVDAIQALYTALGETAGWLGFPMSYIHTAESLSGPDGRFQHFEGGTIYWTSQYGTIAVRPDIRWVLSRESGLPIADEQVMGAISEVRVQLFENCIVTVRDGTAKVWTSD